MKEPKETLQEIKRDSKTDIGQKLAMIFELIQPDDSAHDDFKILEGRWRDLENTKRSGSISDDLYITQKNSIRKGLMDQINVYLNAPTNKQSDNFEIPFTAKRDGREFNEKDRLEAVLEELKWAKDIISKNESYIGDLYGAIETVNKYGKMVVTASFMMVLNGSYHLMVKAQNLNPSKEVVTATKQLAIAVNEFNLQDLIHRLKTINGESRFLIDSFLDRRLTRLLEIFNSMAEKTEDGQLFGKQIIEFSKVFLDTQQEFRNWIGLED